MSPRFPGPLPLASPTSQGPSLLAGIITRCSLVCGLPVCASSLWAQLSSMQTGDSVDAAAATAKTQFLQKMQTAVSLRGWDPRRGSGSEPGLECEEEPLQEEPEPHWDPALGESGGARPWGSFPDPLAGRPAQLHAQRSRGEAPTEGLLHAEASNERGAHGRLVVPSRVSRRTGRASGPSWTWPVTTSGSRVDPKDWTQEYRSLLTLEGLQALAGQCLHRLQELQELRSGEARPQPPPPPPNPSRTVCVCAC